MSLKKLLAGKEDITFGLETEEQYRVDTTETITQVNTSHIPHSISLSAAQAIDENTSQINYVNGDLNDHKTNYSNPHKVDINQIGAAPVVHQHQISDVLGLQTDLDLRPYTMEIYLRTQFINTSIGAADAGKPIVLNSNGKIDPTIAGSGQYLVGYFTPTGGNEYPDASGEQVGAYWVIQNVAEPGGYTFVGGDLAGVTIFNGDKMINGTMEWVREAGLLDGQDYYRLDGTIALPAPLAGGGQQLKNIAAGTEVGDAVEWGQMTTLATAYVRLDGTTPMTGNLSIGGNKLVNVANGALDTDGVNYKQVNDWLALKVAKTSDQGSAELPVGTSAQRDVAPNTGFIRYNSDLHSFEGYGNGSWGSIGGGATGTGTDDIFYENGMNVTESYELTANKNAMTAGPVTIDDGVIVTIPDGANWSVV